MTPDYQDDDDVFEPPVNPIPPAVLGIVGLIAVIEIVFQLANAGMIGGVQGIGWRVVAGQDYGLSPALFDTMVMLGDYGFENLRRFVTYAFVHYDLLHMVFAGVLLLALGKFVGELLAGWAVGAIFLAATVLGGLAYVVLAQGRVGLLGA
jgi:membrane associated rhomboid family serine protease